MADRFESDEELVAACGQGNREAWDVFVERFSRLIYWAIHRVLEDARAPNKQDLCSEIFQEVFTKLLEKGVLNRIRSLSSVRKYLTVLACRTALDRLRRNTVHGKRNVPLEDHPSEGFAGSGGIHPQAFSDEDGREAARLLAGLKPKERSCLILHYWEGLTHREIGEVLGMPQDTVSTVIRRARERLKGSRDS